MRVYMKIETLPRDAPFETEKDDSLTSLICCLFAILGMRDLRILNSVSISIFLALLASLRAAGMSHFASTILLLAPFLGVVVVVVSSLSQVMIFSVRVRFWTTRRLCSQNFSDRLTWGNFSALRHSKTCGFFKIAWEK